MHTFAAHRYTRSLTRKQLARYAYNIACVKLDADARAGLIQAEAALLKFRALRDAYQARKQQLELGAWLRSRGLGWIAEGRTAL